jgi:hypothetical protein
MTVAFIEIHQDGYLKLHEELPSTVTATLLGLLRGFWIKSRIFGTGGVVYRVVPEPGTIPKPTLGRRLLANTVYNPRLRIPVRYESAGHYTLAEVKGRIARAVAQDDDVLTQFMEPSEIRAQLDSANSFEDVLHLVRKMTGEDAVAQQGVGGDEGRDG